MPQDNENPLVNQSETDIASQNLPLSEAKPASSAIPTPKAKVPTKISPEKQKRDSGRFLLGCVGGLLVLFIVFLILMVFVIAKGGAGSPILQAFGVSGGSIKTFLLTFISSIFGLLAVLFIAVFTIGLFRISLAKKEDKVTRRRGLRLTFIGLIPLLFVMMVWMGLYAFISGVEIASEAVVAEIVVKDPKDLSNLVAPVEVRFSAANVVTALQNGGVTLTALDWDLNGDGVFETPATDPEITHIYSMAGTIRVGLRATVAGEKEPRIYTFALLIPEAVFGADPLSGTAPLNVSFDASILLDPSIKVSSLDWDFDGDGRYDIQGKDNVTTSHVFDKIGDYKVHLRMVDQSNNVRNFYHTISVVESTTPNLSAVIDVVPGLFAVAPVSLRFDGSASVSQKGDIIKYEWDFGDGTDLAVGKSVSKVFDKPGQYTVTLHIYDSVGQKAEKAVQAIIQPPSSTPQATIVTTPALASGATELFGELPLAVHFEAQTALDPDKQIVGYQWDFQSDGTVDAEGQKTDYTFTQAGDYKVSLTLTDSQKQTGASTLVVHVTEPGVKVVINATPVEGSVPLDVSFDASKSSAFKGKIVTYTWDFGDNTAPTVAGATLSHRFDKVGTYLVKLTLSTDQGQSSQGTQQIFVREVSLHACFSLSRRDGMAPLSVSFDSICSTGTIAKYQWDFGDGAQSTARKMAHTFETPGTYKVTLQVIDDKNNISSFSDTVKVNGELK